METDRASTPADIDSYNYVETGRDGREIEWEDKSEQRPVFFFLYFRRSSWIPYISVLNKISLLPTVPLVDQFSSNPGSVWRGHLVYRETRGIYDTLGYKPCVERSATD